MMGPPIPPGLPPGDDVQLEFVGGPLHGHRRGGPRRTPVAVLREIVARLEAYLDVEPDDQDKAIAAQCLVRVQQLLARNQRQVEVATGASPASKFLARKSAGL